MWLLICIQGVVVGTAKAMYAPALADVLRIELWELWSSLSSITEQIRKSSPAREPSPGSAGGGAAGGLPPCSFSHSQQSQLWCLLLCQCRRSAPTSALRGRGRGRVGGGREAGRLLLDTSFRSQIICSAFVPFLLWTPLIRTADTLAHHTAACAGLGSPFGGSPGSWRGWCGGARGRSCSPRLPGAGGSAWHAGASKPREQRWGGGWRLVGKTFSPGESDRIHLRRDGWGGKGL